MDALLVAAPGLWVTEGIGAAGTVSYFDVQRMYLRDSFSTYPGEHLALRSIQSYCRAQDLDVEVVNAQVLEHTSLEQTLNAIEDLGRRRGAPAVIGLTGPCELFEENCWLATRVKERWPDTLTVLGHDFATLNHRRILDEHAEFDLVVRGEGERAFAELVRAAGADRPPASVPGLALRTNDGLALTAPHPPLDLDDLPWPCRDDLPRVLAMGMSASLFATRGCLYRCTYCTTGAMAGLQPGHSGYRARSVANVVDEIEMLVRDHRVRHVTIVDDLFVARTPDSRERAAAFAEEVIRRGLDVTFQIDCRVDSIEEPLFRLLRRAGVTKIFVGVETGSDEQLAFYRKVYERSGAAQVDAIKRRLRVAHDLGMSVVPGMITYHPEVTQAELALTAELIDYCGYAATYQFWSRIMAYPGTPLYETYRRRGWLTVDWPVPEWRFANHAAERHYRRVKQAAKRDRWDFAAIRSAFRQGLADWDAALPLGTGRR